MDYMSMFCLEYIKFFFFIIFGNVLNFVIKWIMVEMKENGILIFIEVKMVKVGVERNIWFVLFFLFVSILFEIKVFNEEGVCIVNKEINDLNDSGVLLIED